VFSVRYELGMHTHDVHLFVSNSCGRPLGRPRRRWEDNIKMDLQKVGCGIRDIFIICIIYSATLYVVWGEDRPIQGFGGET
jgi:hypothetical protein